MFSIIRVRSVDANSRAIILYINTGNCVMRIRRRERSPTKLTAQLPRIKSPLLQRRITTDNEIELLFMVC